MWVRSLADSDASCGGKAAGLARLIAAGLPVPEGFVIDDRAFASVVGELAIEDPDAVGHVLEAAAQRIQSTVLPQELVEDVEARARAIGIPEVADAGATGDPALAPSPSATLVVRSSATIEDRDVGAAAGVFSSITNVPASVVWPTVRAVWASALTPLAAGYARTRGGTIAIGVIVQRLVPGERYTVYTRPPGDPRGDEAWVQHGDQLEKLRRDDGDPRLALALRAEAAIGAEGGADVELVDDPGGPALWVVQARPIVHPAAPARTAPPPAVLAALVADGRRWTWDVAHNPDPLSPAQAGLVELVDRARIAPWSLRVCAGHLYTAPRGEPPPRPVLADRAELEARAAVLEHELDQVLAIEHAPLEIALERYLAFYRIWAREVGPLIAAARAALAPEQLPGARPSAVEATLLAAARGELDEPAVIARIGVLAPAWDVAVPTFAERPQVIRDAIARARPIAGRLAAAPAIGPVTDLARAGADLGERDDVWFARAQWLVRRALLERGAELGISAEDVFWLPLDELRARQPLDPDDVRRRASAARAAAERSTRWSMPVVVGGTAADEGPLLYGIGSGPRVTGRVRRFASLASAVVATAGDVVVARAVTPALAVFMMGCAAIVSDTGGPLDHGAALARELGIPFVVGCRDAWTQLSDGMLVSVDGDAGTVTRLSER